MEWQQNIIAQIRQAIAQGVPHATEEAKFVKPTNPAGVPTFYDNGMLWTIETYKDKVKITFAKGAKADDSDKLFNSSLEGNARRAIDYFKGDSVDVDKLASLMARVADLNKKK